MVEWIKKLIRSEKDNLSKDIEKKEDQKIMALLHFLWKQIDYSSGSKNLKSKIKTFENLSLSEKIDTLPEIYLNLEEHLIEKQGKNNKKLIPLRKKVLEKHGALLIYRNFKLIFDPHKEQELLICKTFLFEILEKSSELLGEFKEKNILLIKQHLSNEVFFTIKNSIGFNPITNIYLSVYKKQFATYHLLDSFTSILNVIPEEILSKNLINFPSKQQMLKMLQKQLFSLEEINERLTKEIIERKNIEEELKYSEHLNTTILETAMDGVILINSEGIVLNWNGQAENILDLKKEETIGKSIFPLVPVQLRQELKDSFVNYIKNGDDELINKRIETSVFRKDGSPVYLEITIIAIEIKDDYLFNAFFRDITNKKIVDKEIREAKVVAEKSAKAKSVFLSNMSHEIRTPLNVILGLTGILQKSDLSDPETDQKNLDGIQFSAENLLILVNDILDFSKIEAGKLMLHKTDFNIYELISNISRGFEIKAQEKGIKYQTIIDPKIPKFIIGDQSRLNQILVNLLGNSIKFTQKGSIVIEVTLEKLEQENITIKFLVQDTGIGISKDKLDHIFESFYQVQKPGKNKIEGTGLGLSISKQLIELQGGKLYAKSKPNVGSTFHFSITYVKSKFKSYDKNLKGKETTKKTHDLSGLKMLVVEDNKMNQFYIKQLLSNWDIDLDIADHGKIALEKIENETYDIILMDMHMPIMDGPKTTIQIRKSNNPKISNIPIVACSADVFPESKKKAIESGMNFYLTKPISEEALEEILFTLKPDTIYDKKNSTKTEITALETPLNSGKLFNLSFLKKTFNDEQDIILEVLQIFIEDTPNDYEHLKLAIQNKNFTSTMEIAHKIKSSFNTLGLEKETKILEKIEYLAKEKKEFEEIHTLFNRLDASYTIILKEITQHIKKLQ